MVENSLYSVLVGESEKVRWQLSDIDWSRLQPELASPALRALVREMAFSEHATFSATQKFMQTFFADIDFTSWLSVWFYEETRHPHILMAWLERLGDPVDEAFVLNGRVSTPFMKSVTGTLVTNIISEVAAANAYGIMAETVQEPVLAQIARYISGDEARHASAFFGYAKRRIGREPDVARQRLDALKVLHFWLEEKDQVTHPINQMIERLSSERGNIASQALNFDLAVIRRRVTAMVGHLLGLELRSAQDVGEQLRRLTVEVHEQQRAGRDNA